MNIIYIVAPYFLIFIISLAFQLLIIKLLHNTPYFLDKKDDDKPQRIHLNDVRRIGGIGIFAGLLIAVPFTGVLSGKLFYILLLSLSPVFLIGLLEDLKRNISRIIRLLFVAAAAVLAVVSMRLTLSHVAFVIIPVWIAVLFAIFAVVGVTNALNLIDGLNGLASGYAIISFLILAAAAYASNDFELFKIILIFISAALGFFILNYPKGIVFLGDSGSYILGFSVAVLSILLVLRNPGISEWFVFAILLYPVFETLFSIYRRIFIMSKNPASSDRLHLHTLLAKRVFRSNYAPTFYILSGVFIADIFSLYFNSDKYILISISLMFILIYISLYGSIVKFRINVRSKVA